MTFEKMEEYVHRTRMSLLPAKLDRGITPERKNLKSLKSKFASDLVYKFQIICLMGT
jgi:hypothetical protein